MPREVTATTRASTASSSDGDDHGDDEAGEPGGGVGPLQRVLLARGAEDAAEAVDHEVDAQQQRDGGQHQRRRPEVAAQPAVEQPGGDEAARQPRVVEALHAGQPGTLVGGRGVDRRVGVGSHGPGADEHGAGARRPSRRPGRRRRAPRRPLRSSVSHQLGVAFGGGHARRRPASRGGPRTRASASVSSGWRRSAAAGPTPLGQPGATRRPQRITMPGPCHSSSRRPMSRQAARELSVGSGGSSRSPMTSTRRPRATRMVRSAPGRWVGDPGHRVDVATHAGSIVSPPERPAPPP